MIGNELRRRATTITTHGIPVIAGGLAALLPALEAAEAFARRNKRNRNRRDDDDRDKDDRDKHDRDKHDRRDNDNDRRDNRGDDQGEQPAADASGGNNASHVFAPVPGDSGYLRDEGQLDFVS